MPAPTQCVLSGGGFQDSEGNLLANGVLHFLLSQDGSVSGVGNICSGIEVLIQLDADGNATSGSEIWGNDVISPPNNFYRVTGYSATGQPSWGPNNQQVVGSTFDLGTWVPNQIVSWVPPIQVPELEVNGTPNLDQQLLNLTAGSGISITDEGAGEIEISNTATGTEIEIGGTPISTQSPLNFQAGSGIAITNPSAGNVDISNTSPGASYGSGIGAFFLGPGITDDALIYGSANWGQVPVNLQNGSVTANQVVVYLFELSAGFTISKVSSECTDNVGGAHATFGIYSQSGNKLVDGGAFTTLTSPGVQTNTITPVTLAPGVYWFAQAATTGTAVHFFGVNVSAASNTNGMITALLTNATRVAIAANALSSGILPATLGTLTPFVPSNLNGDGIACPVFE